jgi:UDP-N-acetylmuramoylalanine--D-glutamate ligase
MKTEDFYRSVKGKTVAFCGLGGSNLPLVKLFAQNGARVTARDRRTEEKLGGTARELKALGVRLVTGEGYLDGLDEEIVFRTPGMKYTLPQLTAARARGAAVTSEMEVFFDLCPCKIVAVTGSDGKTTTTTIISKILESAGKKVHVGGNIGTPLLPRVDGIGPDDIVVAELSSFQLISMRRSPDVAVVTNVSPNHLDIHKDMQEYIGAKKNIILHQNAFGRAVLNADNGITASFAEDVRGQCLTFSRRHPVRYGAWMDEKGEILLSLPEGKNPRDERFRHPNPRPAQHRELPRGRLRRVGPRGDGRHRESRPRVSRRGAPQ